MIVSETTRETLQKRSKGYKVYNEEKLLVEVQNMNMNDPKKRRAIAIVALVIIVAMVATAIIPYLLVQLAEKE